VDERPPTVLVVTGPSGAGKGTLIRELVERVPGIEVTVSATTRKQRRGEENGREGHIEAVDSLWKAIRIVAIADVVMSLDNIIAVAAASRGSYALLMFGLAVSIPLIMAGAAIVIALLERFPVIVWAGAGLLGWIAGEIIAGDPLFTQHFDAATAHTVKLAAATGGAALVLFIGMVRRRLTRRSAPDRV